MGVPGFLRPTRKKLIILAIIIIIAILGFNYFGKPKQTPLQFATVKRQDIKATVSASGTLNGKNSANLRFKLPGKLTFINVKTGDAVFAGQVIAGLDTQDLAIALQQAQNTLRDKQATADKVIDDIHLFQYGNGGFPNVGTVNETMTQRQLRTTAEVARDNAFDSIKASQRAFQDTVIISPINGIITQAIEVPNQIVGATDVIAQVVDDSEVYFDGEVDEADIASVSVGQNAEISLNTYPDRVIKGQVEQIMPNTKTTTSNATVVVVRILLSETNIRNIPGLNGQATITVAKSSNVLSVPIESIQSDNTVYISSPKGLTKIPVVPGIKSDTDVEIKSGLSEGQQIVLNPPAGK